MAQQQPTTFFRTLHEDGSEITPESFLLQVETNFKSKEIHDEVRWRLHALRELTTSEELGDAGRMLRRELSKIFATITDEAQILTRLKELTEVEGADGEPVDLRRFLRREKRALSPDDYRKALHKKINNTSTQIKNLTIFFPDTQGEMTGLAGDMEALASQAHDPNVQIQKIASKEDQLRQSPAFLRYEELKQDFLRQWLGRFGEMTDSEISKLSPEEIQQLIVEHQRHQMTQLLKSEISQSDIDMNEHLEPHDTLEGNFLDAEFWSGCNVSAKRGFTEWVMGAIQAYGMLKGQRYALFQNDKDPDQLLLFGVGVSEIGGDNEMVGMVPFIKPFTRKAGYLLEVRKRELGDPAEYHGELRHYVMPFLFAFDAMKKFKVSPEILTFFTSNY